MIRSAKKFVATGNLNVARYKHTAALLPDGRVLVAGGSDARDWHGTTNSAEIYDPRTREVHDDFAAERSAIQVAR